jgi:methionine synthase II (cobalamin-independent)
MCGSPPASSLAGMTLPTEPIGSFPRPPELLAAIADHAAGRIGDPTLEARYVQLAGEAEPARALAAIAAHSRPDQRIFVGVTNPIDPVVETAEQVRDRVLRAADFIPPDRLGTCDDCGFAPFADDVSKSRQTAWDKVRARIEGTALAGEQVAA